MFVLHGLGGCGKTAVACALFEHATRERGRLGRWVNASDQASLRAGMLAVAADRGARDGELMAARNGLRAAADLVWDHLDRSDTPWLLVLDNADDPAVLRDGGWLRTSPRGTVLVTTRQTAGHWWPAAELLYVDVLPREEAAQVLRDLAPGTGSAEDAAAIADSLGRLPLALTLAGGYLAHQVIAPWTMEEYGRRLQERPDPIELIDQGAIDAGNDSRHLVSGTWQLSLNSLAGQNLPEAVTLLRLLPCWSSGPLPLSLLANVRLDLPLPPPTDRVAMALRGLPDHSLTELVPGDIRCLRTHGVLLDSVARVPPAGERDQLAAAAASTCGLSIGKVYLRCSGSPAGDDDDPFVRGDDEPRGETEQVGIGEVAANDGDVPVLQFPDIRAPLLAARGPEIGGGSTQAAHQRRRGIGFPAPNHHGSPFSPPRR